MNNNSSLRAWCVIADEYKIYVYKSVSYWFCVSFSANSQGQNNLDF